MYSIDKNDEIAYDLISKMIHPFYWERYTIEDCLKHNFFNSSSLVQTIPPSPVDI